MAGQGGPRARAHARCGAKAGRAAWGAQAAVRSERCGRETTRGGGSCTGAGAGALATGGRRGGTRTAGIVMRMTNWTTFRNAVLLSPSSTTSDTILESRAALCLDPH